VPRDFCEERADWTSKGCSGIYTARTELLAPCVSAGRLEGQCLVQPSVRVKFKVRGKRTFERGEPLLRGYEFEPSVAYVGDFLEDGGAYGLVEGLLWIRPEHAGVAVAELSANRGEQLRDGIVGGLIFVLCEQDDGLGRLFPPRDESGPPAQSDGSSR
jgi:hypothetical protein